MDRNQKLLSWLQSEKKKDDLEEKVSKEKFIQEIKKIKKTDLFPKQERFNLWQRIKIVILGK